MNLRHVLTISFLIRAYFQTEIVDNKQKYLTKKFNEVTWLTAHNSHLNGYDNAVLDIASNQNLSIEKQLSHGVRGFMFDIDYLKCTDVQSFFGTCPCEGVCLCHGSCSKSYDSIKDGFSLKKLEYALRKLVRFLTKNPDQIITIFFEDYLNDTRIIQSVFERVKNFNKLVFNPYSTEWDVLNKGWPIINEMVKANKRILIFDDEQRGRHAGKMPGFIRSRDYMIENHYQWHSDFINVSLTNFSSIKSGYNTSSIGMEISRCYSLHKIENKPNWSENKTLDLNTREHEYQLLNSDKLFLFNHFYGVAARSVLINPLTVELMNSREFIMERLNRKCNPGVNGKKPNYIALDFITSKTYSDLIIPFNDF